MISSCLFLHFKMGMLTSSIPGKKGVISLLVFWAFKVKRLAQASEKVISSNDKKQIKKILRD